MNLKLWVSTEETDDMDIFAGIKNSINRVKKFISDFNHIENGQVATGWLRVSHRELDKDKSTIAQPWHKHEQELKIKMVKLYLLKLRYYLQAHISKRRIYCSCD